MYLHIVIYSFFRVNPARTQSRRSPVKQGTQPNKRIYIYYIYGYMYTLYIGVTRRARDAPTG